jgi:hypothetical protein
MNSVDFCFWLQGYFELQEGDEPLTAKQVEVLKNHLSLVFKHEIDPMRLNETQATEAELNEAHTPYHTVMGMFPLLDGNKLTNVNDFPSGNDPLIRC